MNASQQQQTHDAVNALLDYVTVLPISDEHIAELTRRARQIETAHATVRWSETNLQGWPVLRVWRGAVYLRIPEELRRPIEGGCSCTHCRAHKDEMPSWDTLGVPITGSNRNTWTLHAPDWRVGDKVTDGAPTAGQDLSRQA